MIDLRDMDYVRGLKSNLHVVFDSPQGQEIMKFLERIGHWNPHIMDSNETNDIIGRDANRRLIGTLKTILDLSPEQIVQLAKKEE